MPHDKHGNKLTWKEFMGRWKKGIEGITPFQQINMQIKSTWVIVIGLFCGIVISLMGVTKLWWLFIILTGGLGNTSIQLIGFYQKKWVLQKLEGLKEIDLDKYLKGGKNVNKIRKR